MRNYVAYNRYYGPPFNYYKIVKTDFEADRKLYKNGFTHSWKNYIHSTPNYDVLPRSEN